MTFFSMLPSDNENSERESNIKTIIYVFIWSASLVSFTDPNNKLPNLKPVFKPVYIFVSFLGAEILSIYNQCPLKFTSSNI